MLGEKGNKMPSLFDEVNRIKKEMAKLSAEITGLTNANRWQIWDGGCDQTWNEYTRGPRMTSFEKKVAKNLTEEYSKTIDEDTRWLTDYAQDKKDCQRLIEITTTMFRAKWLLNKLMEEIDE